MKERNKQRLQSLVGQNMTDTKRPSRFAANDDMRVVEAQFARRVLDPLFRNLQKNRALQKEVRQVLQNEIAHTGPQTGQNLMTNLGREVMEGAANQRRPGLFNELAQNAEGVLKNNSGKINTVNWNATAGELPRLLAPNPNLRLFGLIPSPQAWLSLTAKAMKVGVNLDDVVKIRLTGISQKRNGIPIPNTQAPTFGEYLEMINKSPVDFAKKWVITDEAALREQLAKAVNNAARLQRQNAAVARVVKIANTFFGVAVAAGIAAQVGLLKHGYDKIKQPTPESIQQSIPKDDPWKRGIDLDNPADAFKTPINSTVPGFGGYNQGVGELKSILEKPLDSNRNSPHDADDLAMLKMLKSSSVLVDRMAQQQVAKPDVTLAAALENRNGDLDYLIQGVNHIIAMNSGNTEMAAAQIAHFIKQQSAIASSLVAEFQKTTGVNPYGNNGQLQQSQTTGVINDPTSTQAN